jgi:hypothetical protein
MHANTYNKSMNGTNFDVTAPILLMPPIMTAPTKIAKTHPVTMVGTPK